MRTKGIAIGIVTIAGVSASLGLLLSDTESGARSRSRGAEASERRGHVQPGLAAPDRPSPARREAKASRSLPKPRPLALGETGLPDRGGTTVPGATALAAAPGGVAALASSRKVAAAPTETLAAADKEARRERALQALAKVDWPNTLRDLAAGLKAARAEGRNPDVNAFLESAQINLALAEAAKALGLQTPTQALGDPTVRSEVVPGWLEALGVDLSPGQAAAVASACLTVPPPSIPTTGSVLDARQAAVKSRLALEQAIGQVLTPDQMNTYYSGLASDPLKAASSPQLNLSAATPDALAQIAASYWANAFKLGAPSQQAALQVAAQYVASVLAMPPPAPNLDPAAARVASLDAASQLAGLQKQAEQALAASPGLTDAERSRATSGSNCCLKLTLSSRTAQGK